MGRYDLIVVGAGIVGAACADCASAEGLTVLLVEPGPIGGGVTAASMGHLVSIDGLPAELALASYSQQQWEILRDLPDIEYSRCGTLWVAGDDQDWERIPQKARRLADAGVTAVPVDAKQLHELEPSLAPGLAGGLLVEDEGVVYPPAVARRLVERACRQGAALRCARVTALGDHEVTLEDGSRVAGAVLVANGRSLTELLPELPLRLRKGHLVITDRYPGVVRHQLVQMHYTDTAHGDVDDVAFNVQPRPTGQILIGSSREYGSDTTEVSLPMVQRMLRCAFAFVPKLRQLNALRIWTGLRPTTPDGLPYIGRVAGRRGIWVAAGHEGLGVTTAPGTARLLLDLLQGRESAIDTRPYDPARVAA